jgi:hypothetical protein
VCICEQQPPEHNPLYPCTHSVGKRNTVQHHKPAHRAHKFTLPGKSICSCEHLFLFLFYFHFYFIFYFIFHFIVYFLSCFIVFTHAHLLFLLAVCPATLQPGPLHSCHTHKRLLFYPLFAVTVPVHLLYFTVAPGFSTMVLLFYLPIVYSRYDRFCFTMLFTYCVFLVVINCGLHPLLYILEAVHSCLSFHVTHEDKDAPWGWHVGVETCRSRISNKYMDETQCTVLIFYA